MSLAAPSLTARLAALFALSSTVLLLATGTTIYLASEHHFIEQDSHDLHRRVEMITNVLAQDAASSAPTPHRGLPAALDAVLISHHEQAVLLLNHEGATIYAHSPEVFAALRPAVDSAAASSAPTEVHSNRPLTFRHHGQLWRGVFLPTQDAGPVRQIWLAIGIDHHAAFLASLFRWLLFGGAAAAILSGALGVWVARRGLLPLQKISANATLISAQRLSERLDEAHMPRELLPLVRELNAMLARLDDAFRRLTEFSSDIAHELRTPISNLVTQTGVALTRARSTDEYRDVLGSNLEEFGRLGRMISDMLFLARADHGLVVPNRSEVDLAHEVDALISFYEALADEKGIHLRREGNASTYGDALMLRRVISNLLANAVRHASPASGITIRLSHTPQHAIVEVCNQGQAIPPAHLPRLFDRFYRGDAARQHQDDNTGLGLAIVKSIVEAHGGSCAVFSDQTATRFVLTLPKCAAE